jgi:signal transduction histidine kinase/CheY-like chemotaxis protein
MGTNEIGGSSEPMQYDLASEIALLREKSSHIAKAARSATIANVLAPLLCIPMFMDEVSFTNFAIWLSYMFVAVAIRTWVIFKLPYESERIVKPERDLRVITSVIGIVGFGWGLGWILMAPELHMVNRMIYVYMTTAAMISSMFAYSVNRVTFLAFTLPIMIPSLGAAFWWGDVIPWPFAVGLATLYIVVLSISKNFAKTFEDSVRLRFRNEHLYQELVAERDQSVAANVAKSKFIATASHDLRQPMHAVNVYLELLNIEHLPEVEKKSIKKIKSSISTLNAMFDALLNVSKLDAGVMQVTESVFRLESLANTLRDLNEAKALEKGLTLKFSYPDSMVRGDKLILQQIIGNLLSNAIQYTEDGCVEVSFTSEQDCLVIEVRDTGLGIAEAEQKIIFNQFYRANKTRNLHDGLGLGLSIVQRLCSLIGCEIILISELGKGSQFRVKTSFSIFKNQNEMDALESRSKTSNAQRTLQGKQIVVIEDNPIIAEAYKQTLSNLGAYVELLSEHESEIDVQLETLGHIDCILSDYRLRTTTGDVLIQKLRENYNEDIPAIIVTADTSPLRINYFAMLDIQVLHKPVSFHEITLAIESIMQSK